MVERDFARFEFKMGSCVCVCVWGGGGGGGGGYPILYQLTCIGIRCCWILQDTYPLQGVILDMGSVNERGRYYVTPSLISRAHTQNDPCIIINI